MIRDKFPHPKNIASIFGIDDAILAAVTIGSSLLGKGSADKQLGQQQSIADKQNQIAQEQLDLARELAKRGIATQKDSHGNVTYYDQDTNTWTTVLSPTQQALQNVSDRQQLNSTAFETPFDQNQRLSDAIARSKTGSTAESARFSLEDSMRRPVSGNDISGILRNDRASAVNKGFDSVSSALTTQALRSGASGMGDLGGALAKQRSQAIASTMGSPQIEGMQLADQLSQNRIANKYNTFSGLDNASRYTGTSGYSPVTVGTSADSSMQNARTAANSATKDAGSLIGSAGGILGNIKTPDYSSLGNLLGPTLLKTAGDIASSIAANRTASKKSNITVER